MNTAGVLDDYLEQLLGDAVPAAPAPLAPAAAPAAEVAAQDEAEAEGVAQAISAEFAHPLANDGQEPAAFDSPTSPGAPANLALLDELMN
ncbi:MAG TPA: hypothetical protein DGV23_04270, partial [Stenotrophomonas sp.]|nr:hypothetical protein [Stenotrophomonas sp.]